MVRLVAAGAMKSSARVVTNTRAEKVSADMLVGMGALIAKSGSYRIPVTARAMLMHNGIIDTNGRLVTSTTESYRTSFKAWLCG